MESFVRGWLPKPSNLPYIVEYAADFTVPLDFGSPGAVLISNLHGKEFHLMEIVIHGFDEGPIFFPANSWIHSRKDNPESRIIFRNQVKTSITLAFSTPVKFSRHGLLGQCTHWLCAGLFTITNTTWPQRPPA